MTSISLGLGVAHRPALASMNRPTVLSRLAALNAFEATVSTWNPADRSMASMSESRTAVSTVAWEGPIGQLFDQKSSNDCTSTADDRRPLASAGMLWDGYDDEMGFAAAYLPATITVGLVYKGTAAQGIAFSATGSGPFGLYWKNGNTGATGASGTAYVDGVSCANRHLLHAAMADGQAHGIEQRDISTGGFPALVFSGYGASLNEYRVSGILLPLYILNPAAGDYMDALLAAHAFRDAVIAQLAL